MFVWVLKASSLEFSETDKESLILWVWGALINLGMP